MGGKNYKKVDVISRRDRLHQRLSETPADRQFKQYVLHRSWRDRISTYLRYGMIGAGGALLLGALGLGGIYASKQEAFEGVRVPTSMPAVSDVMSAVYGMLPENGQDLERTYTLSNTRINEMMTTVPPVDAGNVLNKPHSGVEVPPAIRYVLIAHTEEQGFVPVGDFVLGKPVDAITGEGILFDVYYPEGVTNRAGNVITPEGHPAILEEVADDIALSDGYRSIKAAYLAEAIMTGGLYVLNGQKNLEGDIVVHAVGPEIQVESIPGQIAGEEHFAMFALMLPAE